MIYPSLVVRGVFVATFAFAASVALPSSVWAQHLRHRAAHHVAYAERPLTIGPHRGIYRSGDDIIAPGGFSAQGYGDPPATPDERREALNARIRANATGLYGAGTDGIGGWGFDDLESGYDNPYYGNSFNRYIGFDGVPSQLAFGPGFANRRQAEHDPFDDPDESGPSPEDLGYAPSR